MNDTELEKILGFKPPKNYLTKFEIDRWVLEALIVSVEKQRDIQWVKYLMHEKQIMCDIPPTNYGQDPKGETND